MPEPRPKSLSTFYCDISYNEKMAYRNIPLPEKLYSEVKQAIELTGAYASVSEFVRETVRDRLEELKIVTLRELPKGKVREEILNYLKNKGVAYPSDIADELRIDYHLVIKVLRELWEEEKIEEAKE